MLVVVPKASGSDGLSCLGVFCPESKRSWGQETLWLVLGLPLQGHIYLDIPPFIRTVVERGWCRRGRGRSGLRPHELQDLSSNPCNLKVQGHQLGGHRTDFSFYTAKPDQLLVLCVSLKNGLHQKLVQTLPR